jgi:hypothetical protein
MRFVSLFRFFILFHHEAVLGTMQVYTGTYRVNSNGLCLHFGLKECLSCLTRASSTSMHVTACRHTSPALLPQARAHRYLLLLLLHKGLSSCRAHQQQWQQHQQQHQLPAPAHNSSLQAQAPFYHPRKVLHQQLLLLPLQQLHLALVLLLQQQTPKGK